MNAIQYIAISSVCLSVFYAIYRLIAKNETNFRQLRFFLLTSILISLLMPLSSFEIALETASEPGFLEGTEILYNYQPVVNYTPVEKSNPFIEWLTVNWFELLKTIYYIVFIMLFTRIVVNLTILFIHYFKSERKRQGSYTIVYNSRFKNTFSFFNWIFINTESSSKEDFDQIISHEKIHASQYHSLDLILIELLAAAMWFNPLVWMMRNSMQLVHEYLADEGVLSTGIDRLKYQALLINQVTGERLICLSSSFNKSLIKKRMIMMTKSNFNQKTKLKILALFPASAVIFIITALLNGISPQPIQANNTYSSEELFPDKYAQPDSKLIKVDDTIRTKEKVIQHKLKDTIELTKAKERYNLVNIETKGTNEEENSFIIRKTGINAHHVQVKNSSGEMKTSLYGSDNILYILDGVVQSDMTNIKEIDPDKIDHVSVTTSKGILKAYKDEGYDGVVEITTKSKSQKRYDFDTSPKKVTVVVGEPGKKNQAEQDNNSMIVKSTLGESDNNPLIIVDGVPLTKDSDIKDIDPDKIESVSVLKNESATALYGEKAANGVILITTKGKSKKLSNFEPVLKADTVVVRELKDKPMTNPLYIIDGIKQSEKNIRNDLDSQHFEKIEVIQDKNLIKLYTDKDHDGVYLITTKGK